MGAASVAILWPLAPRAARSAFRSARTVPSLCRWSCQELGFQTVFAQRVLWRTAADRFARQRIGLSGLVRRHVAPLAGRERRRPAHPRPHELGAAASLAVA